MVTVIQIGCILQTSVWAVCKNILLCMMLILLTFGVSVPGLSQSTTLEVNVSDCEGPASGSVGIYHHSGLIQQLALESGTASFSWNATLVHDYDPKGKMNPGAGRGKLFAPDGAFDAVEAHAFWRMIPRFKEDGIDPEVIEGLARWADAIWTNPNTDWEQWFLNGTSKKVHPDNTVFLNDGPK